LHQTILEREDTLRKNKTLGRKVKLSGYKSSRDAVDMSRNLGMEQKE
jgi:hypothetical protein